MAENDVRNNEQQEDLSELIKVRRDKLRDLQEAGKDPFKEVRFEKTAMSKEIVDNFEKYEGKTVSLAGRLVSKRVMGKASFAHILDGDGQIQLYFKRDVLGDEPYAEFKKYDIGDIIGVTGEVFVTHMGETTVNISSVKLLSKSLLPLPEKFHGLTNTDLRYRQRYVDLIVNPEVKSVFVKRSMVLREIRNFLDEKGYLEVETPVLHNIAGGANARPFITHHNTLDIDMYLRIALELYLKRLIVGGFEKVYEIGRVFRNEGMDQRHNPEFTLLELYEAYTDIHGMMDITEGMFRYVANKVCGTGKITFDGVDLDLDKPFERISMVEAVRKYAGVDFDKIETLEEARAVAKEHHLEYEHRHKKGDILNLFIEAYVEDKLVQPTFLTGHPVEISP
ncbi:MAG: lysine--tRNA ligase, partial [Eubacteriales bacterium]|nr:lysine--tRNA ligase [Eubacteriales bacterium]